jgi:hypothetical protein
MHPKEAIFYTFNKFFYDLLEDIQHANDELATITKQHYKVKNMQSTKNLELFSSGVDASVAKLFTTVLPKDLLLHPSMSGLQLAKGISLGRVIESLDNEYHNTILCYLYNFMLMKVLCDFANTEEDESNVSALFNQVMQVLKHIQNKEDYTSDYESIYDEDIRTLLKYIDETSPELEQAQGEESSSLPDIENTKIGSMAKEISEELDLSDLKIEKPDDVLKLMSSNALGNIIGKVGDKIQNKISSGQIKQEDLVSEAFSMLSMLNNGGGGSSILNNPLMQELMKNKNVRVDPTKLRAMSTKDRLKRKLDERKASRNT